MQTFLSIVLGVILGWGCSYYAKRRGRNPTPWFFAGLFFGIFALLILFILPVRKAGEKTVAQAPSAPKPAPLTTIFPLHAGKLWYFLDEQKAQFGPMSFDALSKARHEGKVQEQTYVWNETMENWQRFQDVIQAAASVKL
jgi:hypothetical protein